MFSSAASGGVIHRLGPVRTNQLGLVFSATALLFTLTANPWCLALSAVLIGTGYGPNTPSGSEVLGRVTPPRMRGLVFSIKQSGAPLGAMAGGLILPAMVVIGDWRVAVATGALIVYAARGRDRAPAHADRHRHPRGRAATSRPRCCTPCARRSRTRRFAGSPWRRSC